MNATASSELRRRLSDKYVGRAGIHGIGIRVQDSELIVCVYLDRGRERTEVDHLFNELTADASPYKVVVLPEEVPAAIERAGALGTSYEEHSRSFRQQR